MDTGSWARRIAKQMKCLGAEFRNDELAYLALTSKIEKPIVDRLAYNLHRDNKCACIAREWTSGNYSRGDLAVIVDRTPKLILEAKAMYSFDMFANDAKKKYPEKVNKDVEKMQNFKPKGQIERLAMILLTDTKVCPDEKYRGIVKYIDDLKKSEKSYDELRCAVERNFECRPIHSSGSICAGRAFDVDVTVHYWLFGPLSTNN